MAPGTQPVHALLGQSVQASLCRFYKSPVSLRPGHIYVFYLEAQGVHPVSRVWDNCDCI